MTRIYFGVRICPDGDIRLARFHLRRSPEDGPGIPDRRACIMKYRSGSARRAPTRGAFASPIEFLPPLALRRRSSFVRPAGQVATSPRVNFPAALEALVGPFLPAIEKKRNPSDFFADAHAPMKQSVGKVEAMFTSCGSYIERKENDRPRINININAYLCIFWRVGVP